MGIGTAERAIQNRVEAEQVAEAIKYGQRAMEAGRGRVGCAIAGGWMEAQCEAAITVAEYLIDADVTSTNATWMLKRAAKIAKAQVAEAKAAVKAVGTQRQLRIAMAA